MERGSRPWTGRRVAAFGVLLMLAGSACTSAASPSTPTAPASSVMPGKSIVITAARAIPVASNGNALSVVASIRNDTGLDDAIVGGSSPGAKGGLYSTCGCLPARTDPETGLVNKSRMTWWKIPAGETVALRSGDGEMILLGLPRPLAAGDTIEVTFQFESAGDVTVAVPVVASID